MHFHMIQELHDVTFPDLGQPYTMVEQLGLHLTTDRPYVQKFVGEHFGAILGDFQTAELLRQNAHLISQGNASIPQMSQEDAHAMTRIMVMQSLLFLQSLWLVKDNSVNAGRVYFAARQNLGGDKWTHDTPPYWFCTADCQLRETAFSKAEVEEVVALYRASSENSGRAPYDAYRPAPSAAAVKSRTGRALLAARSARAVDDIGMKVAFYCVSFEALLSTDTTAVAHRIAERTAILIGTSEDRQDVYRDMKKLYDGRSKVLHGSHLKDKDLQALFDRATRCDDYLRRTLRRLLLEEDLKALFTRDNTEELDKYFLDRLLPNS